MRQHGRMKPCRLIRDLARKPPSIDQAGERKRLLAMRGYCRKHGRRYALNVMWQGHPRAHGCIDCHPALKPFEP